MNHLEALSERDKEYKRRGIERALCDCDGELEEVGMRYHSDVYWTDYECKKCGKIVITVEGRIHNWNHESGE